MAAPVTETVRLAAHGLVVNERNEFVVIRQEVIGQTFWDVPGGQIESGESEAEAAAREIKEEIGIEVELGRGVGTWQFRRVLDGRLVSSKLFLCRPLSLELTVEENPIPDEYIAEARWVSLEQYLADEYRASDPSLKELIRATLSV